MTNTKVVKTMTDSINGASMPPPASAEQMERIARIRERRAGQGTAATRRSAERTSATEPTGKRTTGKRRGRHVAGGSRILAAGLGATSMFGIVTVLGLDTPVSGAGTPAPTVPATQPVVAPPVAPPVQVVIHRIPASTVPAVTAASTDSPDAEPVPTEPAPVATTPPPVQLTANPVVKTVTVAAPSQPRSQASSAPAAAPAPAPAPAPTPSATTKGSG
jgi:hypothetical protein